MYQENYCNSLFFKSIQCMIFIIQRNINIKINLLLPVGWLAVCNR